MTAPDPAFDLENLVIECLERLETEGGQALADLCARHPEHAPALRSRVNALKAAGLIDVALPEGESAFPERLGDFRLVRKLGGGGMGVVYVAEQTSLKRTVALKLIRPDALYFDGARERFLREVDAVARLAHVNIVPVYTVGEERGIPYFAMEHVIGASLEDILLDLRDKDPAKLRGADLRAALLRKIGGEEAARDESAERARLFSLGWVEACLEIAREVALALEHAHRRGVLHRDVKPSNVMITPSGRVLLLDFGLAHAQGSSKLTRTGVVLGSLLYMAPEQVKGGEVGPRTDVYGLGVLLYEMLTLQAPYFSESAERLAIEILAGSAAPARRRNAAISPDAETVCLKAMDADPARRYASAEDFARDLRNVLELRPIEARRLSGAARLLRWARRNKAASAAVLLAILLFVGGPSALLVQQSRARSAMETKNEELSRALSTAQTERANALANLVTAREAVDRMLEQVADERLRNVPYIDEVRARLLSDAREFLEQFANQRSDDPMIQAEFGRALQRSGAILARQGHAEEAEATLARAMALYDELGRRQPPVELPVDRAAALEELAALAKAKEPAVALARLREGEALLVARTAAAPEDVPARAQLGEIRIRLGELLRNQGDHDAAVEALGQAATEFESLYAAPDRFRVARLRAAHAHREIGHVRIDQRQAKPALEEYEKALAALAELEQGGDDDLAVRSMIASVRTSIGRAWFLLRDPVKAVESLRRTLEAFEGLATDFPRIGEYREQLVATCQNLSVVLLSTQQFDEASLVLDKQQKVLDGALAKEPDNLPFRQSRAGLQSNFAALAGMKKDFATAIDRSRRALEDMRACLAVYPDNAEYKDSHARIVINLAGYLNQDGKPAEAFAALGELKLDANAELYVTAIAFLDNMARASESDAEFVAKCDARATELGRAAIANGHPRPWEFAQITSFEFLRKQPGFAAFCAEQPQAPAEKK